MMRRRSDDQDPAESADRPPRRRRSLRSPRRLHIIFSASPGGPNNPARPDPEEMANYAMAQMEYRSGLATGNGDVIAKANETFRQIPREIFSRRDPKLFEAEVLCERYSVARPPATDRSVPTLIEPRCQDTEGRYNEATNAIRRDLETPTAPAHFAINAQTGAAHP